MKKLKNIYHKITSAENLYQAAYMAARGRRYRDTTADFNFHLEDEVQRLRKELETKTYRHGKYRVFTIYEPKERRIAAAPFRDRVVHHAVHDVIEPMIDKTFIYDSYACRKEKGTHKAVDRAQSFLRANKFCFHGDIKKYFPSIDRGILKGVLRKRVEDKELLWLLDEIIDSAVSLPALSAGRRANEVSVAILENEIASSLKTTPRNDSACLSLRAPKGRGNLAFRHSPLSTRHCKGLPIGNLTSQFFANLYLNELDYFVKFELKCRYYLRYMDDFLVFNNDRETFLRVKNKIQDFLKNKLNLDLHPGKSQIYQTHKGIKFLGFRLFKNYRRLASDNVRRFRKRLKKFSGELREIASSQKALLAMTQGVLLSTRHSVDSVRCWTAHSKYANTGNLRFHLRCGLIDINPALTDMAKAVCDDKAFRFFRERERERERERGVWPAGNKLVCVFYDSPRLRVSELTQMTPFKPDFKRVI